MTTDTNLLSLARKAARCLLPFIKDPDKQVINLKYFQKIVSLVPELASYHFGALQHLEKIAESKSCDTLRDYYKLLINNNDELEFLKTNLTMKGTHFFRGNDWDLFSKECLSNFEGKEHINLWCAGCSSGEEAYSLLMALSDYVPIERIELLATDYNDELLKKCMAGEYFNQHYSEIPEHYQSWVECGPKKFLIRQELKDRIETRNLNLLSDEFPNGFDVILCRNVLKFFTSTVISEIQKKLSASLNCGGYIFLSRDDGPNTGERIKNPETLGLIEICSGCIYQKKSFPCQQTKEVNQNINEQ